MMMNKYLVAILTIILIFPFSGMTEETTASFRVSIEKITKKLNLLNSQKSAELLSPYNYKKIIKKIDRVAEMINKGGRVYEVKEGIAEIREYYKKIHKNVNTGRPIYTEILKKRLKLVSKYNSEPFLEVLQDVDEEIRDGGDEIEDGDLEDAEDQKKAINKVLFKAEVAGARELYLRKINRIEKSIMKFNPKKKFPKSLKNAQKCKEAFDEFLKTRPGDSKENNKRMNRCNELWMKVTAFLSFDDKIVNREWGEEEYTLYFNKVVDELVLGTKRATKVNLSIQEKVSRLLDYITEDQKIITEYKELFSKLEKNRLRLESLEINEKKRNLIRNKYEDIKEIFDESIGQVRREEDDIVIDIYGLTFNVGSFEITSKAFPILEKIKKAVQLFHGMPIELTGHTDSDGDPYANKILSRHRAKTVFKFLKSTGVISDNYVVVKGKGDSSPLLPNTTMKNKRKNRRVEVRIKDVTLM